MIPEYEDRDYPFRMIILFDHGLFHRKKKSLEQRVCKTKEAFDDLSTRINTYRLKTQDAIDKACKAILKKYKTQGFFEYTLINDPVVTAVDPIGWTT